MIGVVVLNYIDWDATIACVRSILSTTKDSCAVHIWIVDNASPNDPPDDLDRLLASEHVSYVQSEVNGGYSAGNNLGIERALGAACDYVAICNSDVIFGSSTLCGLAEFLEVHPFVGIVGPRIRNLDGSLYVVRMAIPTGLREKYFATTFLRHLAPDILHSYVLDAISIQEPTRVHSVSGSFFVMTRRCAEAVTPLDEKTFLYEEELILGRTVSAAGFQTIYHPGFEVYHAGGTSTRNVRARSFTAFVQSELYYLSHYVGARRWQVIPLYVIRSVSFFIRALRSREFRTHTLTYLRTTMSSMRRYADL